MTRYEELAKLADDHARKHHVVHHACQVAANKLSNGLATYLGSPVGSFVIAVGDDGMPTLVGIGGFLYFDLTLTLCTHPVSAHPIGGYECRVPLSIGIIKNGDKFKVMLPREKTMELNPDIPEDMTAFCDSIVGPIREQLTEEVNGPPKRLGFPIPKSS